MKESIFPYPARRGPSPLFPARFVEGGNLLPAVQAVEGGGAEGPPGIAPIPGFPAKKGFGLRFSPQEGEDQLFRRRQLDVGIGTFQGLFKIGVRLFPRGLKTLVIGTEGFFLGRAPPGAGPEEEA